MSPRYRIWRIVAVFCGCLLATGTYFLSPTRKSESNPIHFAITGANQTAIGLGAYEIGGTVVLENNTNNVKCQLFYLNGEPVVRTDMVDDPRQYKTPGEYIAHCTTLSVPRK